MEMITSASSLKTSVKTLIRFSLLRTKVDNSEKMQLEVDKFSTEFETFDAPFNKLARHFNNFPPADFLKGMMACLYKKESSRDTLSVYA
ncbi:hypothetical protein [Bacillus daqingensis]|uniref:hypothetical protein n=1 Tax=Bacillus daqingensis TaxID=872396 RepID=UPI003F830622